MIETNITVVKVLHVCLGSFSWNMDKHADPDQMPHINLDKINNNTQQILAIESIHPIDKVVTFHWAKMV